MKGITLAADAVVVIVLAGVVLLVILAFFKGSSSQGISQADLQQERTRICREYTFVDHDCDGVADKSEYAGTRSDLEKKAVELCKKLGGYTNCDSRKTECIQDCCGFLCSTTVQKTTARS